MNWSVGGSDQAARRSLTGSAQWLWWRRRRRSSVRAGCDDSGAGRAKVLVAGNAYFDRSSADGVIRVWRNAWRGVGADAGASGSVIDEIVVAALGAGTLGTSASDYAVQQTSAVHAAGRARR